MRGAGLEVGAVEQAAEVAVREELRQVVVEQVAEAEHGDVDVGVVVRDHEGLAVHVGHRGARVDLEVDRVLAAREVEDPERTLVAWVDVHHDDVLAGATPQGVARAAEQGVVAVTAEQNVAAVGADELVVTGAAQQGVVADGPEDLVVARGADDVDAGPTELVEVKGSGLVARKWLVHSWVSPRVAGPNCRYEYYHTASILSTITTFGQKEHTFFIVSYAIVCLCSSFCATPRDCLR